MLRCSLVQDRKLAVPVMLADLQSRGARYCLNPDYNMYMPVGERPADLLYEHLPLYVRKVMDDLKNIEAWDRRECKHVRALWRVGVERRRRSGGAGTGGRSLVVVAVVLVVGGVVV